MSENVLNDEELEEISGGVHNVMSPVELYEGCVCATHVETGYLALRTDPYNDDSNIIGQLWNGSRVSVMNSVPQGDYIRVVVRRAAPGQWGGSAVFAQGYVNWHFLQVKDRRRV